MTKLLLAIVISIVMSKCSAVIANESITNWRVRSTESNIIKALAGEAGGQSDAELLAHCHAIRNRITKYGDLRGVYGLRAPVSVKSINRARIAWNRAKTMPSSVGLCDHWLSMYDLKHSRPALIAWRHKAVYSVKVGMTTFY